MKYWLLVVIYLAIIPSNTIAKRIITLGSDITEIVFALNAGEYVIARDTDSQYPVSARHLPSVGHIKTLNAKDILSTQPTMVLASERAKPFNALIRVQNNGVRVVKITSKLALEAIPEKIKTIAKVIDKVALGEKLIASHQQELSQINTAAIDKKVLFIVNKGGVLPLAAGLNTAADSLIRTTGAQNAMTTFHYYHPLSPEMLMISQPDLIITNHESIKSLGGSDSLWRLPGISLTPAAKNKSLLIIDDIEMYGFSLNTPKIMLQIRQALEAS
ncbi:heme/hemin ABC transporter substrate-binding protein [Providencia sp. Me31A]|uniref:heme/hemin ABC transporter substrate-binding protein n=1 Tax=Providencia sp. Me31A TaxID=3392637 RepID=UPI003D27FA4C